MFASDPRTDLARLERDFRDAEERFLHAPGGLWLASSATLEALGRVDPTLLDDELKARVERLATDARRAKADAHARASQHELAALAEWVELARHRAVREEAFLQAARFAPRRFGSRAELAEAVEADERELERLSRHVGPPSRPENERLVASLRATHPEYDPDALPEEIVFARGRAAEEQLSAGSSGEVDAVWTIAPFPSAVALLAAAAMALGTSIGVLTYFGGLARFGAAVLVVVGLSAAAALLVAALVRRRSEMARRVLILEAWGRRVRARRALEQARARHERWVGIAQALGELDAFRRSEEGLALEAREQRLPALAPWVRTLVGGLDEETARRFA